MGLRNLHTIAATVGCLALAYEPPFYTAGRDVPEAVGFMQAGEAAAWAAAAGGWGAVRADAAGEVVNALDFDDEELAAYASGDANVGAAFKADPSYAPPRPRAFHSVGVVNERFYVFGGVGRDAEGRAPQQSLLLNDLHFFDVAQGGWSGPLKRRACCRDGAAYDAVGARPAPRAHAGAAVIGARLYVFGGVADAEGKQDTDVAIGNYAFEAASPSRRALGDVHYFDESTATWSGALAATGDLPAPRFGAAVAAYGDALVVFGGVDGTGADARADVFLFNATSLRWRSAPPAAGPTPTPRAHITFAASYASALPSAVDPERLASDQRLYVYGGAARAVDDGTDNGTAAALCDDTWALDVAALASRKPTTAWTRLDAGPGALDDAAHSSPGGQAAGARSGHELHCPLPGVLVAIGGLDSEGAVVDQHAALDLADGAARWRDVTRVAAPRATAKFGAASALADGGARLYQFGGFAYGADGTRAPTDDFHVYAREVLYDIPEQVLTTRTSYQSRDSGLVFFRRLV